MQENTLYFQILMPMWTEMLVIMSTLIIIIEWECQALETGNTEVIIVWIKVMAIITINMEIT